MANEFIQTHKSNINKKPLSHTTSSQIINEEILILPNWKITNIIVDNYKFYL